jgi:hypothetical protein
MSGPSTLVQHPTFVQVATRGSFAVTHGEDIGKQRHNATVFIKRFKHTHKIARRPDNWPGRRIGGTRESDQDVRYKELEKDLCIICTWFYFLYALFLVRLPLLALLCLLSLSHVSSVDPPFPGHQADHWDLWALWCMISCCKENTMLIRIVILASPSGSVTSFEADIQLDTRSTCNISCVVVLQTSN